MYYCRVVERFAFYYFKTVVAQCVFLTHLVFWLSLLVGWLIDWLIDWRADSLIYYSVDQWSSWCIGQDVWMVYSRVSYCWLKWVEALKATLAKRFDFFTRVFPRYLISKSSVVDHKRPSASIFRSKHYFPNFLVETSFDSLESLDKVGKQLDFPYHFCRVKNRMKNGVVWLGPK